MIELVEGLIAAGKQTLANRVQALVSKIFSFALDASLRDDHPCHRLKMRGVENVGRRVLSDAEMRLFWNGIVRWSTSHDRSHRTGLGCDLHCSPAAACPRSPASRASSCTTSPAPPTRRG